MSKLRGGFQHSAESLKLFMKRDIREKIADEIIKAKDMEKKALDVINKIVQLL